MTLRGKVIFLVIIFLFPSSLSAQAPQQSGEAKISAEIYFRQSKSDIDTSYLNNATQIEALIKELREIESNELLEVKYVHIISYSSIEGRSNFNSQLSRSRTNETIKLIESQVDLKNSIIEYEAPGEGWPMLKNLLEISEMTYKTQVLQILNDTPIWAYQDVEVLAEMKQQLKKLNRGKTWKHMSKMFFPYTRVAYIEINYGYKKLDLKKINLEFKLTQTEKGLDIKPAVYVPRIEEKKSFVLAVKSNLLFDLALIPNIGLEYDLGKHYTISANYFGAWWNKNNYFWRIYGGELGARRYFGELAEEKLYSGHHCGAYAQVLTYDFELGKRGYLSDISFNAGLEYGYSLPIAENLNIDFSLGLGYFGGVFKVYDPEDGHYVWKETRKLSWFGPSKAEIAIVWLWSMKQSINK